MDRLGSADVLLFEAFRFDRGSGDLLRLDEAGIAEPVAIGSRALSLLRLLVERAGELISKDAIMEAVWPGMVVEEGNLTVQVSTLRRILDQGRDQASCIQTVPGRGYRFVAPVTQVEHAALPASASSPGNGSDGLMAEVEQAQGPGLLRQIDGVACASRPSGRHRLRGCVMGVIIGALVLAAAGVAGNWHSLWPGDARPAPRLSIVVLPFANLGDDPEQQYFADGVTEDLTIDLSRIAHMFVISRNTAFTYRNGQVDTKQIGHELGVRYVLEGTVRRSGNQLRVTAQLIDAATDAHLWAERFDRETGDLFALQNEITSRIAVALNLEIVTAEAARPTQQPDAFDYILRGRAELSTAPAHNYPEAIRLFERALALDPDSVEAKSRLATALAGRVLENLTDSREADTLRAEGLIRRALAASPLDPLAHFAKGVVLRVRGRPEEAILEFEAVLAFDRNAIGALFQLGWCKLMTGSINEVIPLAEQGIRLSPRDPYIANWYSRIGLVHLLQSQTSDAVLWLEKARNASPSLPVPHLTLASTYALKGETERAAAELAEARRLRQGSYSSIAQLRARVGYWGVPKIIALHEATFFAGLRKAGVPEE